MAEEFYLDAPWYVNVNLDVGDDSKININMDARSLHRFYSANYTMSS
jgi:hypothetical protein